MAPLFFFVRGAAPPPARGGPCSCSVPPRRPCRQAGPHSPPRRPGPGLSPLGVSLAAALWPSSGPKGMRRHENCPACPGRPPAGLWPPVAGGCRGLVVWGRARRGSSPVCPGQFSPPPEARGAQPPRPGSGQSGGPGLGALRAARRAVWPFPPVAAVWPLGAFLPPRVGRAALGLPWPVPAWGAVIGWPGAPSASAAGMGAAPLSGARAVVLFGLVPCRRRPGPRFSDRAGQRW